MGGRYGLGAARRLESIDRAEQVVRLVTRGWRHSRIADELGIATGTVRAIVERELRRRIAEPTRDVELMREQEIDRLQHLIEVHDMRVTAALERAKACHDRALAASALGDVPDPADIEGARQLPDPVDLKAIADLSDRLVKLCGLAMPIRVEHKHRAELGPDVSLGEMLRLRAQEARNASD